MIRRQTLGQLERVTADDHPQPAAAAAPLAPVVAAVDRDKPPPVPAEPPRHHSGSRSTVRTEFSRHFEFDDQPDTTLMPDTAADPAAGAQVNKKPQSKLGRAASPPVTAVPVASFSRFSIVCVTDGQTDGHLPLIYPETASSLRRSPPHLIYPSLDRPHSPLQTASRSNQPFCDSTPSG